MESGDLAYLRVRKPTVPQAERAMALANVAMSDAGVASWDAKFTYWDRGNHWRLDNTTGLAVGQQVGKAVIERAETDGAPPPAGKRR